MEPIIPSKFQPKSFPVIPKGGQITPFTPPSEKEGGIEADLKKLQATPVKQSEAFDVKERFIDKEQLDRYPNEKVFESINYDKSYEDAMRNTQGEGERLLNTAKVFGANALSMLGSGLATIPNLIGSVLNNTVGKTEFGDTFNLGYDSGVNKTLYDWREEIEKGNRNYKSDWAEKHWIQNLIPIVGDGGFQEAIKSAGYGVGVGLEFYLTGGISKALSLGTGAMRVATTGAKVGGNIAKGIYNSKKIAEATQGLVDATRVASLTTDALAVESSILRFAEKIPDAYRLYVGAHGEASFEALEGQQRMKQSLISLYEQKHGRKPIGEELATIEKTAKSAGESRYWMNMGLLAVPNYLQVGKLMQNFPMGRTAKSMFDDIAPNSVFYNAAKKEFDVRNVNGFKFNTTSAYWDKGIGKGIKTVGEKSISLFNRFPKSALSISEGFEELGQTFIDELTSSAYKNAYLNKKPVDVFSTDAFSEALGKTLSKEGAESFLMGIVSGATQQGGMKLFELLKSDLKGETAKELANSQYLAETFNNLFKGGEEAKKAFDEYVESVNTNSIGGKASDKLKANVSAANLGEASTEAALRNDQFNFQNLKQQNQFELISEFVKTGKQDILVDYLSDLKTQDKATLAEFFGIDADLVDIERFANDTINRTKELAKIQKDLSIRYVNPYKQTDLNYSQYEYYKTDMSHKLWMLNRYKERQSDIDVALGTDKDFYQKAATSISDFKSLLSGKITALNKEITTLSGVSLPKEVVVLNNELLEEKEKQLEKLKDVLGRITTNSEEEYTEIVEEAFEAFTKTQGSNIPDNLQKAFDAVLLDRKIQTTLEQFKALDKKQGFEKFTNEYNDFFAQIEKQIERQAKEESVKEILEETNLPQEKVEEILDNTPVENLQEELFKAETQEAQEQTKKDEKAVKEDTFVKYDGKFWKVLPDGKLVQVEASGKKKRGTQITITPNVNTKLEPFFPIVINEFTIVNGKGYGIDSRPETPYPNKLFELTTLKSGAYSSQPTGNTIDKVFPLDVYKTLENLQEAIDRGEIGSVDDIEAKKADIEKRRKEELKSIDGIKKISKGKTTYAWRATDGVNVFSYDDAVSKEEVAEKINAKYDAELRALEGKEEFPIIEPETDVVTTIDKSILKGKSSVVIFSQSGTGKSKAVATLKNPDVHIVEIDDVIAKLFQEEFKGIVNGITKDNYIEKIGSDNFNNYKKTIKSLIQQQALNPNTIVLFSNESVLALFNKDEVDGVWYINPNPTVEKYDDKYQFSEGEDVLSVLLNGYKEKKNVDNLESKKADIERRRKYNLEDDNDPFDFVSSIPRLDGRFNAFYVTAKESKIFDTYQQAVDWINSKYDEELKALGQFVKKENPNEEPKEEGFKETLTNVLYERRPIKAFGTTVKTVKDVENLVNQTYNSLVKSGVYAQTPLEFSGSFSEVKRKARTWFETLYKQHQINLINKLKIKHPQNWLQILGENIRVVPNTSSSFSGKDYSVDGSVPRYELYLDNDFVQSIVGYKLPDENLLMLHSYKGKDSVVINNKPFSAVEYTDIPTNLLAGINSPEEFKAFKEDYLKTQEGLELLVNDKTIKFNDVFDLEHEFKHFITETTRNLEGVEVQDRGEIPLGYTYNTYEFNGKNYVVYIVNDSIENGGGILRSYLLDENLQPLTLSLQERRTILDGIVKEIQQAKQEQKQKRTEDKSHPLTPLEYSGRVIVSKRNGVLQGTDLKQRLFTNEQAFQEFLQEGLKSGGSEIFYDKAYLSVGQNLQAELRFNANKSKSGNKNFFSVKLTDRAGNLARENIYFSIDKKSTTVDLLEAFKETVRNSEKEYEGMEITAEFYEKLKNTEADDLKTLPYLVSNARPVEYVIDRWKLSPKGYIKVNTTTIPKFETEINEIPKELISQRKNQFNRSLFRGIQNKPSVDENGNLLLQSTYDTLFKSEGISFANNFNLAYEYGSRYSQNPYIIELDWEYLNQFFPYTEKGTKAYGNTVGGDEGEARVITEDFPIIPKDKYNILRFPSQKDLKSKTLEELRTLWQETSIDTEVAEFNRYGEGDNYAKYEDELNEAVQNELIRRGVKPEHLLFLYKYEPINGWEYIAQAMNTDVDNLTDEQSDKYFEKQKQLLKEYENLFKSKQITETKQEIPVAQAVQTTLFDDEGKIREEVYVPATTETKQETPTLTIEQKVFNLLNGGKPYRIPNSQEFVFGINDISKAFVSKKTGKYFTQAQIEKALESPDALETLVKALDVVNGDLQKGITPPTTRIENKIEIEKEVNRILNNCF